MFDKRQVSLKKLAAKQTRPVQPVAPHPESSPKRASPKTTRPAGVGGPLISAFRYSAVSGLLLCMVMLNFFHQNENLHLMFSVSFVGPEFKNECEVIYHCKHTNKDDLKKKIKIRLFFLGLVYRTLFCTLSYCHRLLILHWRCKPGNSLQVCEVSMKISFTMNIQ